VLRVLLVSAQFCRQFCGTCEACREAMLEEAKLAALYASLSEEDLASLHRRDEDDPRTYALDTKGRP
jgi:NADH:ubiquinone oxidoreductase subunit F (NADH-binding)